MARYLRNSSNWLHSGPPVKSQFINQFFPPTKKIPVYDNINAEVTKQNFTEGAIKLILIKKRPKKSRPLR